MTQKNENHGVELRISEIGVTSKAVGRACNTPIEVLSLTQHSGSILSALFIHFQPSRDNSRSGRSSLDESMVQHADEVLVLQRDSGPCFPFCLRPSTEVGARGADRTKPLLWFAIGVHSRKPKRSCSGKQEQAAPSGSTG